MRTEQLTGRAARFHTPAVAAALLFAVSPVPTFAAPTCELPGEAVQWIADYCMRSLQTDDEIAASDCIAAQLKHDFPSSCATKRHFKRALCALDTGRDVERCVADPNYLGSTVRRGGVGG